MLAECPVWQERVRLWQTLTDCWSVNTATGGRMLCCVEMSTTRQQRLLSCYDSLRNVNLVTEKGDKKKELTVPAPI